MAHARDWLSPYNYVQNNAMLRVDPTGMIDNEILLSNADRASQKYLDDKWAAEQQNMSENGQDDDKKKKRPKQKQQMSGEQSAQKVLDGNLFLRLFVGKTIMDMGKALDVYQQEGYDAYIYTVIGNTHREIAMEYSYGMYLSPWANARPVVADTVTKGISVIGPRATYREFAKKIGAQFLNVTDANWSWQKNLKFLEGVVKRGDDVLFAGTFNPKRLDNTSVLAKEIKYLERNGYKWTSDFTKMTTKK